MTPRPTVVALEGPCCAGKTTLGRLLMRDLSDLAVAFVPCYADFAGGGRFLPRQETSSVGERQEALRQLLDVEAARRALVPDQCDVVLQDRSVHTLLANSYALERITGTRFLAHLDWLDATLDLRQLLRQATARIRQEAQPEPKGAA